MKIKCTHDRSSVGDRVIGRRRGKDEIGVVVHSDSIGASEETGPVRSSSSIGESNEWSSADSSDCSDCSICLEVATGIGNQCR